MWSEVLIKIHKYLDTIADLNNEKLNLLLQDSAVWLAGYTYNRA